MRAFSYILAAVAVAATANADALEDAQAELCTAYKQTNPDDTTSDSYKSVCDSASGLTMGAVAVAAAAAALAF